MQRDFAKHAQYAVTTMASKIKPDQISEQAGRDRCAEGHERVHHSHGPKGSRAQQPGNGRKRQSNLFQEQIKSASRQAATVAPKATNGFIIPMAQRAPAPNNQGTVGSGSPICSKNTTPNNNGPPWLARNWAVSLMGCLG